jgi:hypothetical protein
VGLTTTSLAACTGGHRASRNDHRAKPHRDKVQPGLTGAAPLSGLIRTGTATNGRSFTTRNDFVTSPPAAQLNPARILQLRRRE